MEAKKKEGKKEQYGTEDEPSIIKKGRNVKNSKEPEVCGKIITGKKEDN